MKFSLYSLEIWWKFAQYYKTIVQPLCNYSRLYTTLSCYWQLIFWGMPIPFLNLVIYLGDYKEVRSDCWEISPFSWNDDPTQGDCHSEALIFKTVSAISYFKYSEVVLVIKSNNKRQIGVLRLCEYYPVVSWWGNAGQQDIGQLMA